MNKKRKEDKTNLVRLFLAQVNETSEDPNAAEESLRSEGVNVDRLKSTVLAKIRKKQLEIEAARTEQEMSNMGPVETKATAWVDNLLDRVDFSLIELVREEELTASFSHLEKLNREELRNLLIRHFTLKFMQKKP